MENPIKMDDLGGKPTIFGNIHIYLLLMVQKYVWSFPGGYPFFQTDWTVGHVIHFPFRWESPPRQIRVIPVVDKPAGDETSCWGGAAVLVQKQKQGGLKTRGDECWPQELIEI